MKSTFLLILFCIIPWQLFAQLEQGTFLLGGGLSAYSNNNKYTGDTFTEIDELGISFYPEVGYFIIENIAAGLNAKIESSALDYDNQLINANIETNTLEYSLGPYVRYYTPIEPFAFYFELNYQFGSINRTTDDKSKEIDSEETEDDIDLSLFAPTLGLEYFINKSVGVTAVLRYEIGKTKYDLNVSEQNNFNYEQEISGFVFLIALQFHLNFSETN